MSWSLRLLAEMRLSVYARFLTLTYRDENLPPVLDLRDVVLFMKKLRKRFHPAKIRFFCCGEYGTRTQRPHWHLMMFLSEPTVVEDLGGYGEKSLLSWQNGFVYVGDVTLKSAMYVAKYSLQSVADAEPCAVTMSRRPGIGLKYFKDLGEWCATKMDSINGPPPHIAVGKQWLPLDRNAKATFVDAYLRNGGAIDVTSNKYADHLVAVAHERFELDVNETFNEVLYRKALINGAAKARKI